MLQGVRYKKTVMVLAGVAISWLDLYLGEIWKGYDNIRFSYPHINGPINIVLSFYPQIIAMGVLGSLLGQDAGQRVKLAVIGLVVAVLFAYLGLIFLMGSGASH